MTTFKINKTFQPYVDALDVVVLPSQRSRLHQHHRYQQLKKHEYVGFSQMLHDSSKDSKTDKVKNIFMNIDPTPYKRAKACQYKQANGPPSPPGWLQ